MNSPALAASAALRPSLFAAPGCAGSDPSDARRLLTSLLPAAPASRWPAVPRWTVGGALLAGVAVAIWAVSSGPPVARAQTKRAISTPVAPQRSAASSVEPAAMPQGARIEVESPAPVIAAASAPVPVRDPFRGLSSSPPAAQSAASAQPVHAVTSASPATTRAALPAAAPGSVGAAPARAAGDSDVDLIEAVMARVTGPAAASGKPVAKPAVPDKTAPKTKPTRSAKAAAGGAHEPARARPLSLVEQMQQCRAAGGLDSLLCRNRVCEGHWGADAACPVNQPLQREP